MKIYILSILLLIYTNVFASEDAQEFNSPDSSCKIVYKGPDRGEGVFYNKAYMNNPIYKGYVRYGPIINWESNSLAEILIPTGSPNYHSYYYNCLTSKLSPRFNLAVAIDETKSIVATIEQGYINFHSIDSEKSFYTHETPKVGLAEYFIYCESESQFITTNKLEVKMSCGKDENYTYEINVPNKSVKQTD